MKISLDPDRCQGHGRCFSLAPKLFDTDDLGNGFVIGDGNIGPEDYELARLAAANCPEQAISVEE